MKDKVGKRSNKRLVEAEYKTDYIECAENADIEAEIEAKIKAAQDALKAKYTALKDETAVAAIDGFGWYMYDEDGRVVEYCKEVDHYWGSYQLPDDFAYDGETADGTH
ncbi:MAG: hypothetical protein J6Z38_05750, partial [Lachnospiraceae bacterium]|nr:hypothetical protein [Lachnospiraceae bacterium]